LKVLLPQAGTVKRSLGNGDASGLLKSYRTLTPAAAAAPAASHRARPAAHRRCVRYAQALLFELMDALLCFVDFTPADVIALGARKR
jgi:hypothetical protein